MGMAYTMSLIYVLNYYLLNYVKLWLNPPADHIVQIWNSALYSQKQDFDNVQIKTLSRVMHSQHFLLLFNNIVMPTVFFCRSGTLLFPQS